MIVPPVVAIGYMSCRQQEEQSRQKQGQAGVAKIQRPVSDRINLPGDRDRLRLGADNHRHPGHLIATKVARRKSRQSAGMGACWRLSGVRVHILI